MGKIIPRIVIEVRGGNVVETYADSPIMISIIDYDNHDVSYPARVDKVYPQLDLSKILSEEDHHLIKDHPWNKQTVKK